MTAVKTWEQHQFKTPNCQLYRDEGDYYSLDHFVPTRDLQQLQRFPTWADTLTYPANWEHTRGAHYDEANNAFAIIGSLADISTRVATYAIDHADFSQSSANKHVSAPEAIGGSHKQNVVYVMDTWMFVGDDGDVYQSADYETDPSAVYTDGDANALLAVRDTIWLITTADEILKWNPDTPAFEAFFSPTMPLNAQHTLHFRDYFMLFGRANDGTMIVYRVDDHEPVDVRQLATLPGETAHFTPASATLDWSVPFTVHEDDVYFSPGAYLTYDSAPQFDRVPIYVFDGNSVELVDIVEAPTVPAAWGLLSWKGRLLLYFMADGAQHIYVLTGAPAGTSKPFTRILATEEDLLEYSDLYSIAGELIIQVAGVTAVTDGHKFLRDPATNVFTSAWLDMGHPTAVKYLSRLSAVVSGQAADLSVKIEYRTELNGTTGSWTTAAPNTDNQRHVTAQNIGARFHLLQIRLTFTDATSTDPDTRLESIAATYSHGVK